MQPSEKFQSRFVDVNGVRIHYREWGDDGSPDLLLVHGWGTAGVVWIDIADAISDSYHIVVPDNRGNGESGRPSSGYLIQDYAEDVHQLIGSLGLRRPFYVGHSWGANIGTYLASRYPDDISKALLEDPVYWKMVDAFVTLLPRFLDRNARPEEEVRREATVNGLSPEQVEREVYLHRRFPREALTYVITQNRDWALSCEEHLKSIAVPTLILVADAAAGGYISTEEMDHHRRIASASVEFRLWTDVGHMMHAADPDRFVKELREFLDD